MEKIKFKVKKSGNLVDVIYSNIPNISKNTLHKLLRKKDIRVNDTKVSQNIFVNIGDDVCVFVKENIPYTTIYEDSNFIVIDKDYQYEVCKPENTKDNFSSQKTIEDFLKKIYPNIYPIHRIDRNTTGLVLFAKNLEYKKYLENLFSSNKITKKYLAIVIGHTSFNNFNKDFYLFCDKKKSISYISDVPSVGYSKIGQNINTIENFKVNNIDLSLVEIEIFTGKTHQIRALLSYLNHPILGDGKYGDAKVNKVFKLKHQFLNCNYLSFDGFEFYSKKDILKYTKN